MSTKEVPSLQKEGVNVRQCMVCADPHPAVSVCVDCGQSMCLLLDRVHTRQKTSSLHILVTLAEWNKNPKMNFECVEHEQRFCYFDTQCSKLVCRDCLLFSHRGHACQAVPDAAEETKVKLRAANDAQTDDVKRLEAEILKINQTRQVLEDSFSAEVVKVRTYFEKVMVFLYACAVFL